MVLLAGPGVAFAAPGAAFFPGADLVFLVSTLASALTAWWFWRRLGKSCPRVSEERPPSEQPPDPAVQILDRAPLVILLLDADLRVVRANLAACQSMEAHLPLVGRHLSELQPELLDHPVVQAAQRPNRSPQPGDNAPICAPSCPGDEALTLIDGPDGQRHIAWFRKPMACAAHQERLEEQIRAESGLLTEAAESTSRMQSEFIANINHEVRTPMNAIIGYTEMLASTPDLGQREKRFVAIIHRSSLALVAIFNDIMELSKIDSGRIQIMLSSIRLQSLIDEVQELYKETALEKELRFNCHLATSLPPMFLLDGLRLRQVLHNLISNALKFTTRGFVELSVEGRPTVGATGMYDLRFTVADSGIGIQEVDQQRIFELFGRHESFQSSKYSGIGLGLTLCSRLVVMMGGSIDLQSQVGEGARFTVKLRGVRVADHAQEEAKPTDSLLNGGAAGTILVVDDVDLIKEVFIDCFRDTAVQVLTANNGVEALQVASAVRPRLIFMDLNLEGSMDGRMVTERLRRQPETADIPVLVMTGEALEESDYRPLFDGALKKPFRLNALKQVIGQYLRPEPVGMAATVVPAAAEDQLAPHALQPVWSEELATLRRQACCSGSLSAAADLAEAMKRQGQTRGYPQLVELGVELLHYATEPDILGVDRCLAKLPQDQPAGITP